MTLNNSQSAVNAVSEKNISDIFLPIRKSELSKFLMMALLMFCILIVQNLVRATKDSVVITMMGAETISFLKFWGVLPVAFLFSVIYVKLVNTIKAEKIFYIVISFFLFFFTLFGFVLFPYHQQIHLDPELAKNLAAAHPHFKWFILLLSNWSFAIYYIIAELWVSAVYALLLWQFINNITTVNESRRFYPILGVLGQTAAIFAGMFLKNLIGINKCLTDLCGLSGDFDSITVKITMFVVFISGSIIIVAFWFLNNKIVDHSVVGDLKFTVKKNKMGLKEGLKLIITSRYIRLIVTLLLCYGCAINIVEGPWKAAARKVYRSQTEFAVFMGQYIQYIGIMTFLCSILGSNIVRRLGWFAGAAVTPIVVLITGSIFFLIFNFSGMSASLVVYFALSDPVMVAVIIGAVQNILSKSAKYSLFDTTKEMAYVPLDNEIKTKGKATADMIGTKLGKSAGAFIQSTIFIIIPTATYESISMMLMLIFTVISCIWIYTVLQLNKEYKLACKGKEY